MTLHDGRIADHAEGGTTAAAAIDLRGRPPHPRLDRPAHRQSGTPGAAARQCALAGASRLCCRTTRNASRRVSPPCWTRCAWAISASTRSASRPSGTGCATSTHLAERGLLQGRALPAPALRDPGARHAAAAGAAWPSTRASHGQPDGSPPGRRAVPRHGCAIGRCASRQTRMADAEVETRIEELLEQRARLRRPQRAVDAATACASRHAAGQP